jgi:hypothetical protein
MPDFSVEDLEISPYEYVSACRGSEIRDLIIYLVDECHLPKSVLNQIKTGKSGSPKTSVLEDEFLEKMNNLSQKFHSISIEDENTLKIIFNKYL